MENKYIILDRDGVINYDSPDFIKSEEEWIPIPGSLEAIAKLNQLGFIVIVITNQSGVGRGLFTLETLQKIHQKMQNALKNVGGKIDAIYFCPHTPEDHCACRKPKIGLFEQMAKDFKLDLIKHNIPALGDSLRDLEAARDSGCEPYLVRTGNGKRTLANLPESLKEVKVYDDLSTFVNSHFQ